MQFIACPMLCNMQYILCVKIPHQLSCFPRQRWLSPSSARTRLQARSHPPSFSHTRTHTFTLVFTLLHSNQNVSTGISTCPLNHTFFSRIHTLPLVITLFTCIMYHFSACIHTFLLIWHCIRKTRWPIQEQKEFLIKVTLCQSSLNPASGGC